MTWNFHIVARVPESLMPCYVGIIPAGTPDDAEVAVRLLYPERADLIVSVTGRERYDLDRLRILEVGATREEQAVLLAVSDDTIDAYKAKGYLPKPKAA